MVSMECLIEFVVTIAYIFLPEFFDPVENSKCRYYTDPSGTFWQCNAKAIGSGSEGADSSLQEQYNKVSSLVCVYGSECVIYIHASPSDLLVF